MAVKTSQVYDDYVKERELLSKYEQTNYDSYEKAILTLSSAFLVFSVSFLGIIRKKAEGGVPPPPLTSVDLLIGAWIAFAASVFFMLMCFATNATALRTAVADIEPMIKKKPPTTKAAKWNIMAFILYALSGAAFVGGIVLLLMFCARNIHAF